jgi:hypothetical protein
MANFSSQVKCWWEGEELNLDWSTWKVLHLGKLWLYPQIVDMADLPRKNTLAF